MWFSQDTLWLGAVSVALSTLTVLVIYGLARRLLDPTAASIAALLCATCPTFVFAAPLLASEHLSTLLLLLSLLLGCDTQTSGIRAWGATWALAEMNP
jgi:4-amino-4-deoxy-L-arabinose transferase-like glycosyltransferase